MLCAAPAALCADLPIEARAAQLVTSARRRPPTDVPTPFLLAFGWIAIETGEPDRAAELVATAELYDSSTLVGLIYLLATLGCWSDDDWTAQRKGAIARYLAPEHEAAAKRGVATLAEEVERWERRLADRPAAPQA